MGASTKGCCDLDSADFSNVELTWLPDGSEEGWEKKKRKIKDDPEILDSNTQEDEIVIYWGVECYI